MQLTRFDRWLREKFVYETHIQTLRPPESLPSNIRALDLPEIPGRRYKHLFITKNARAAEELIQQLRENNQMYSTQIVDSDAWYVPLIAPKDKSITWWLVSLFFTLSTTFFVLRYIKGLAEDEEFRRNFLDALKLFQNG